MSFIAPFYLWFLPLISIPIIFHLIKRKKYNTIYFSSLKFFLNIQNDTLNKVNIANILLLLIRTLIILFIILIFTNPKINAVARANTSDESTILKIVIDNSYSNTRFIKENSNKIIADILSNYPTNTYVSIETLNNMIITDDYIQNIQFPVLKGDIYTYDTFNIENITDQIKDENYKQYINKDLFLVSDFQKHMFSNVDSIFNDSNSNWNVFLYKHQLITDDVSISDLYIKNKHITTNELLDINVTCNNHTNALIENSLIELYVNDIKVGDNIVNLTPNDPKILNFKTSIPDYGYHEAYIRLNDSFYYFIINIPETINVGLIYDNYNDSKYISNLLNTYKDLDINLNIQKLPKELFEISNNQYDFIFKFTNDIINEYEISKIKRITDNLFIIPLNTLHLDIPFVNKKIFYEEVSLKPSHVALDNTFIDDFYLNELYENYKNNYQVYKYFNLPVNKNTLLRLSNNYALLNKYIFDDISIFLFSISMDLESSNIPISSSFIPLIEYLIFDDKYDNNLFVGEQIKFKKYKTKGTITHNINGIYDYYNPDDFFSKKLYISKPGFHIFKFNDDDSLSYSANINKFEFYKDYSTKDDINKYFKKPIYIDNDTNISEIIQSKISGIYIWRYLLYTLIFLIILEMYISNIYVYRND